MFWSLFSMIVLKSFKRLLQIPTFNLPLSDVRISLFYKKKGFDSDDQSIN